VKIRVSLLTACGALAALAAQAATPVSLFDGKSLEGWEVRAGEEAWWSIRDGALTGGSLETKVPHNTFLVSRERYANFELRFRVRLVKGAGFMNSGIQVRSIRVGGKKAHEMSGYQVDAGIGWWGKLYDESRRNKVIAGPVDPEALAGAVHDWDWNACVIRCEGPRIRSWINGVPAVDFTEQNPDIPLEGKIGLQAHGGGKFLVQFKDITIEELPATPGAKQWPPQGPQSADRARSFFTVPEGFEVELVASEEHGVGKPITVAWDTAGRMWTMTALEYPVDANESRAQAEALYREGGRDSVLVFDEPNAAGPQRPRVFADGLAIPLGLLPYGNGALVQHGSEIRLYEDSDGDGKADGHRVILEGFGIQDSHLLPHQFDRAPSGWVYVAQGLFNSSTVRRPGGLPFADGRKQVAFNQCKLARFRPDGSAFELLTQGPNNIWGMAAARNGEVFIQEANDLGIPVAEFLPGMHYKTGAKDRLRPYAPQIPPSLEGSQMGGTGLSGLAIAEDEGSLFASGFAGKHVFYIANPITNRIQVVTMHRDEGGTPIYEKQDDFLVSEDTWFRPVAIHFGPDGALYVVDWYNRIISHNEVPRAHPDRDKTRGRIWRIRPVDVPRPARVDMTQLESSAVITYLGGPNARLARAAWMELGDRKHTAVVPQLRELVDDPETTQARRLDALRAIEEMQMLDTEMLVRWSRDADPQLRFEAIRAAGELAAIDEQSYLRMLDPGELNFRVRCAAATTLRRLPQVTPAMVAGLVGQIQPAAEDGSDRRAIFERQFQRYLVRWALETHPEATAVALEQGREMEAEQRILLATGLEPSVAAPLLLEAVAEIERPLSQQELELLGSQLKQPAVAEAFRRILSDAERRSGLLGSLLQFDVSLAAEPALRAVVLDAARLLSDSQSGECDALVLSLARHFRLTELAPMITAGLNRGQVGVADGLRALTEIGHLDAELYRAYLDSGDAAVAREAMIGFAAVGGADAVSEIGRRWQKLPGVIRQLALDGLLRREESAIAFAGMAAEGGFAGFGSAAMERLLMTPGADHPAVAKLLRSPASAARPVIRLAGGDSDHVATAIDLEGPFTVEAWVRLAPNIGNADSLLGRRGGADFNFFAATFRVHAGSGHGDVIVARRRAEAERWTHYAVTRDEQGRFVLYIDGELDQDRSKVFTGPLQGLNVGESSAVHGSAADLAEVRVWDHARSADEIRADHGTSFAELVDVPRGLRLLVHGGQPDLQLQGETRVVWTTDIPRLRTPAESRARAEKFERYRKLAQAPGDPEKGKLLATMSCLICHQVNDQGMRVGPDLSGAGAMGVEALLRNILEPGEQLESGYYRHDLVLEDGALLSGFLVEETGQHLTLRQIGADDRVIPRRQIRGHRVSRQSIMPEGLLDGFDESQVADLLSYLLSLK
jgi:putative membrane-bound dehydrogenase-like protein